MVSTVPKISLGQYREAQRSGLRSTSERLRLPPRSLCVKHPSRSNGFIELLYAERAARSSSHLNPLATDVHTAGTITVRYFKDVFFSGPTEETCNQHHNTSGSKRDGRG